jgi:hypothetical protein
VNSVHIVSTEMRIVAGDKHLKNNSNLVDCVQFRYHRDLKKVISNQFRKMYTKFLTVDTAYLCCYLEKSEIGVFELEGLSDLFQGLEPVLNPRIPKQQYVAGTL